MKVLFCATDRPGHIASGPNAWIQRLIPDLRNQFYIDAEVLFIYSGDLEQCPTINFFTHNQLPFYVIDRSENKYVADQVKKILKIVKAKNHDVLVANLVVAALYCSRFLKKYNIPVIGVLHSNDLFYKSVIKNFIETSNKNHLTHVVSVSNYLAEKAKKNSLNKIHFETIPCGTPTTINQANQTHDILSVLYAGRLEIEQKQILKLGESFINASKSNSRLKFTIVGSGTQEQNLKTLLSESTNHSVVYKGAIPPSEITNEMLNHQVFTLLSDFEGMPVAVMEAMACGLVPVCLSEESGINEIIEHGVNGFIAQNRGEDYREKLGLLSENHELWSRMSAAAIKTIKERYASKIVHKKWAELLLGLENNKIAKVKVPLKIRLTGELLYYGDNRKPATKTLLNQKLKNTWMQVRLFIRPRARLRSLLKKK